MPPRGDPSRLRHAAIGLAAGFAVLVASLLAPSAWRAGVRESLFDRLLAITASWRPATPAPPVVIIDINSAALREIGPWPWPRDRIAALVGKALELRPSALAVDIVFDGADERSPAAAARRLAQETGRTELLGIAEGLPDGDKDLAAAVADRPVAFGYVLDPRGRADMPAATLFRRDGAALDGLWAAAGAAGPSEALGEAAAGHGIVSLPGDADGVVRRIPVLASVGGKVVAGLAAEALRLSSGAAGYILAGSPTDVAIGESRARALRSGMLRLVPVDETEGIAIIPAADLLSGNGPRPPAGGIVLIGGTAPELGALRPSLVDPLTSSTLLQAIAVRQLASGFSPSRPRLAGHVDYGLAAVLAAIGALLAAHLRPAAGLATLALMLFGLFGGTAFAASRDVLLNGAPAVAAAVSAFAAAALSSLARTRRLAAQLRRRFEQHLAPGVVERIVANPDGLKLGGERRRITALFTDIEGFTATTLAHPPEDIIAVLDGYFDGVCAIVTRHGGMVDKLVGDAVHAFFNMPFDVEEHAGKAIACAVEIDRWTERYRQQGLAGRLALGRTRIGVETGEAVVGDVGLTSKLDYTAHGTVVNTA
ncbi:MAG: CHASE2 domain-containing protein, partial [Beijerinckiaceae bacterium]